MSPFPTWTRLPVSTCGKMIFLDKFLQRMREQVTRGSMLAVRSCG